MKRSGPPKRKTPLKQGSAQLKRTPLAPRSEKTKRIYKEQRVPFVIQVLSDRPVCEICFVAPSVDVHERRSRGRTGGVHGSAWLDPTNVLALCRTCHSWIDDNPAEAEEHGWLLPSTY